jgi:hypothetical protein
MPPRRPKVPTESEAVFQGKVLEVAELCGWYAVHHRACRVGRKFMTPIQGPGAEGFPDLVLCHPVQHRLLFRELKTDRGHLTAGQQRWVQGLEAAGADIGVWKPSDWERITAELQ